MKLAVLSDASCIHTQRWVDYFVDGGHQVHLVTLEPSLGTKATEYFIESRIQINVIKYLLSVKKVKSLLNQINPDLVNAHFVPGYGFISALINIKPLVLTSWGSDVLISPNKSLLHKARAKYALRRADLVTSDAQMLADAIGELGVDREKIVVVPMGIDETMLSVRDFSTGSNGFTVLSYRNLEPVYNIKLLIESIPIIKSEFDKDIKFVIGGDGTLKQNLIRMTQDLKIENRATFTGKMNNDDVKKYLRLSDVYVSTSLSDSTSVSLLEAMASGIFPVVSDIKGNREWIIDGENGFLFPVDDPYILADRIVSAIKNVKLRSQAAKRNYEIIKRRALWKNNMKVIVEHFQKLTFSRT